MSKLPVCNPEGQKTGEVSLPDALLQLKKGAQAVHDAVEAIRAAQRAGTASTLKRGMVSGGGKKPWRQKGTGRARAGSSRSPLWRGGGVVFGPHPRSYDKKVNRKVAQLAFCRAFSEKVAAGEVTVVDAVKMAEPKTKQLAGLLKKLKADRGALVLMGKIEKNLVLASRNMPDVEVATVAGVNTYQLLRYRRILVSQDAMAGLKERLKKGAGRDA